MRNGALQLTRRALTTQCRRQINHETRRWSTEGGFATRKWSTPLANTIANAIETTGPISIAAYMRQCLTSDQGGYYTITRTPSSTDTPTSDQFGKRGDFITSPEISQVFGELCGIWFMTEWLAQGRKPTGVQLIEMGPGRGTLMNDMLRTITQFKSFKRSIEGVWMVEMSEGLRQKQKELLCRSGTEMKKMADGSGWECESTDGIPMRWVEDIALLPNGQGDQKMPFILAHEFFDALPIHAFESVAPTPEPEKSKTELTDSAGQPTVRKSSASHKPQWRELLVSPAPWRPSFTFRQAEVEGSAASSEESKADFQLTRAKASTPMSLILPERPRYQQLKSQVGSRIEISPESIRYIQVIARRIGDSATQAGAALIIDYGPGDTVPIDSLRGIKSHKIISPFSVPGEADISADVDFAALAEAALEGSEKVEVHGPLEQGLWLMQLGIRERAEQLMKNLEGDGLKAEFESGWKRLVEGGPRGMGKAYKVMSVVPLSGGYRRPVGFGGDVIG